MLTVKVKKGWFLRYICGVKKWEYRIDTCTLIKRFLGRAFLATAISTCGIIALAILFAGPAYFVARLLGYTLEGLAKSHGWSFRDMKSFISVSASMWFTTIIISIIGFINYKYEAWRTKQSMKGDEAGLFSTVISAVKDKTCVLLSFDE
jgi:hypothetical protein